MRMGNDYRKNDKQKRVFFKRRRAGVVLTQSEVDEIKAGRKKLKEDMKLTGAYSRKEFELTASSLGLYFDKNRFGALLLWLLHGRALWALLGAAALFLTAMYVASRVTQLQGHFTINLTDELFDEGFELSDTKDFKEPSARLYGTPVEDAPNISVIDIPVDVDDKDGSHNGKDYFAHTFYLAKRGDGTVDYRYTLSINSESLNCSTAAWVLLFCDGKPTLYAKANTETGKTEFLPAKGATDKAGRPLAYDPDKLFFLEDLPKNQYEAVKGETDQGYRLKPYAFESDTVVTSQIVKNVKKDEVHKYTVVIWLEGDDPDCTNELIGSHIGLQMDFELIEKD